MPLFAGRIIFLPGSLVNEMQMGFPFLQAPELKDLCFGIAIYVFGLNDISCVEPEHRLPGRIFGHPAVAGPQYGAHFDLECFVIFYPDSVLDSGVRAAIRAGLHKKKYCHEFHLIGLCD